MPLFTLPELSVSAALLSAFAILLLGMICLLGGRSRPRGAFAFGLFAIFWGAQIGVANLAILSTEAGVADTFYRFSVALLIPLPYLLVEFAASQSSGSSRALAWRLIRMVAAVGAFAAILLFHFQPSRIYDGVVETQEGYFAQWGPYLAFLVPLFSAFSLALVTLWNARRKAPTPRMRKRLSTTLAGLGAWAGFVSAKYVVFFVASYVRTGTATSLVYALDFSILALVSIFVGGWLAIAARSTSDASERRENIWVSMALLAPFGWGLAEGFLMLGPLPGLHTVGLWRLAGVGVIAYGLARWWNFDLPQRTVRATGTATGVAGSVAAGGATAYGVGATAIVSGLALPIAAGVLVAGATLVPMVRFTQKLFGRMVRRDARSADVLYGQRIDAYRAALEASLAHASLEEDQGFLSSLRERFSITGPEHRVLLYYARNAVLVPLDQGPNAAYERLRLLGEGGGGRTWLARDRVRDRLVVLKEPLGRWQTEPGLRDAALREARLAAKVKHPNVVRIEEVLEQDGLPLIVMEYVDSGTLADRLRESGVLPWREAAGLVHGMLRGMEAIHAAGIIHRDIKPSNILLDSDGMPRISDFGVALPETAEQTIMEGSGLSGTLSYMAPEVAAGDMKGDRVTDVYSCAAVLHECLFGAPPTPTSVLYNQEGVPPALIAVLARGLAMDRHERYPNARAFAEALRKVAES